MNKYSLQNGIQKEELCEVVSTELPSNIVPGESNCGIECKEASKRCNSWTMKSQRKREKTKKSTSLALRRASLFGLLHHRKKIFEDLRKKRFSFLSLPPSPTIWIRDYFFDNENIAKWHRMNSAKKSTKHAQSEFVAEFFYSIAQAAKLARCTQDELLKYGDDGEINFVLTVPEDVEVYPYDTYAERIQHITSDNIAMIVNLPTMLVLKPSYCWQIGKFGSSSQSDFIKGYGFDGKKKSYARFPCATSPQTRNENYVWRTYRQGECARLKITLGMLYIAVEEFTNFLIEHRVDRMGISQVDARTLANYKRLATIFKVTSGEQENLKWFRTRCTDYRKYADFNNAVVIPGTPGGKASEFSIVLIAEHLIRAKNMKIEYVRSCIRSNCHYVVLDQFNDMFQ